MKIAVLMPTRGRPEMLVETVACAARNAVLDDTRIVVGFDDDDEMPVFISQERIVHSVASREDTMGEKWNRLYREIHADLYVMLADDGYIDIFGWDKILADSFSTTFTDNIGFAYFGKFPVQSIFPGCAVAVHRKTIALMGQLAPDTFPFWWIDTWLWEIAVLIGRILIIDKINVETPHHEKQSRGVLEVTFWAELFDHLRPEREALAERIMAALDPRVSMRLRIQALRPRLEQQNSFLRDPANARRVETGLSFDAPADDRYLRAKVRALELMTFQRQVAV